MDMRDRLWKAHTEAQKPPIYLPVDQWADKYRFMNETTREKWFTERMEVARGPMQAVTEAGVRVITVMCCTQLMKTELILNTIGRFVHTDPCPILVVQPKDDLARKFGNVRLGQMIKSTPELKARFITEATRDSANTAQHKEFPGGHVSIVSAKSPSNLAMFAIRIVLLDEIDKYDESSGKEGDPVDLAEERMSKYSTNSLSIRVCSPTIKEHSRIEESYKTSDMRKPFVQCPHCNHNQILQFKNVKWDKGEDGIERHETAHYYCDGCGVEWSEFDRHIALENIDWLQTKEFKCTNCDHLNKPATWCPNEDRLKWSAPYEIDDVKPSGIAHCEECGVGTCPNTHAGFWANKLYSAFRPISDMVKLWLEAQGNIEKIKTFINTQLAETFEEPGDSIKDIDWLLERREKYHAQVPEEVGLLTFGADVQNNRIEVEVVGWGLDEESWSIDYKVIPGDPSNPETWQRFDEYIQKAFFYNDGSYTHAVAGCIDLGGGHTQHVANYCRHRINNRIWPIRGVGGDGRSYPVWPKNPSRAGKIQIPFYNVGVDAAKNVVFQRLLIKSPGAGFCHFPHDREEEWFKQLTAERRVKKWKGTRQILVWDNPKKARNEAFDNRVYAYAALCGLQAMNLDLNKLIERKKFRLLSENNKARLNKASQNAGSQDTKKKKVKKPKMARSSYMDR